jgi:hypothetical protein
MRYLKGVMTLSNIMVNTGYRNQGIATKMLNEIIHHVKEKNIVLRRTAPESDGFKFIYNKFTDMLNDNEVPFIEFNKSFVYEMLESKGLLKKKQSSEKIKLMNDYVEKLENSTFFIESGNKEIGSWLYDELKRIMPKENKSLKIL